MFSRGTEGLKHVKRDHVTESKSPRVRGVRQANCDSTVFLYLLSQIVKTNLGFEFDTSLLLFCVC